MNDILVSVFICTYNQEDYIRESLMSVINQDYSNLEIVISDDCSKDRTYEIVKEIVSQYSGPYKIIINQNEKNLGIGGNVSKAITMTKGELLIPNSGDDLSMSNRVSEIVKVWKKEKCSVIFSNAVIIDENSREKGLYFKNLPRYSSVMDDFINDGRSLIAKMKAPSVWIHGATAAYTRDIFERFEPIPQGVIQEDGVLSFRGLLLGGIKYVESPLMKYRVHNRSISSQKNYNNILKLQQNEYSYFFAQLKDATKIGADEVVIRKVKILLLFAYIKTIIFRIPFLNLFIIKSIKNRNR